ncbi:calcium/calmodulin-dependent protein kinase-like protein [Reticulomyxa filosa]|uniref:Calcium/calmodulin-dependent protein kinase-like protein n=1 Tax=Reticulomyxa filosa TaxID=46433 RepID=X6NG14_RETFI|nr:calcium/calmodulin-dependent protein kinase-like protein [Reticulomyxa filosa]|eukprot:ETO24838.1 calcium/calmodulin-dependent protein kinase-like protein [Reticulomyxa filosa]
MVDVFDNGRRLKMILELCEGGDLFDQILKSPTRRLEEKRAARITAIIGKCLQYLHEHFVVHRDLKPENILFTKSGTLKVTDFGLAHFLKLSPEFHVMHTCCGTPHYVAPEVLGSNEYGVQVDFWSLGVILYIMLSGYQPFNSQSIHAMYGMIIRGQYRFPSPHWDHVSEQAKDCVRNLMCVDPTKRYDCAALLKHKFILTNVDLEELAQQEKQLFAHQKELVRADLADHTILAKTLDQKDLLSSTTANDHHIHSSEFPDTQNKT